MIAGIKAALSLEGEMRAAGIEFHRNKALCPFHEDKNPSLSIKAERFKCWACEEGGDLIDFTEKYHGFSKGDAIKYLAGRAGLSFDRSRPVQVEKEAERSRELVKAFRLWEKEFYAELVENYRIFTQCAANFKTMEEVESFASLMHEMPVIEYKLDLLLSGTDAEKFELFKEAQGGNGSF